MKRLPFPARWVLAATSGLFVPACVSPGGESGYGGYGGAGGSGYGGYATSTSSSTFSSSSSTSGGTGGAGGASLGTVPEFGLCQCDYSGIEYDCEECPPATTCAVNQQSCYAGQCRASCMTDADCSPGGVCLNMYCTAPCTPDASPDGCPSGTVCSNVGTTVDCLPRMPVSPPAGCGTDAGCPVGTTCQGDALHDDGACDPWCQVGQAGGCAAGTSCIGFDTPIVVGGVTYGACRVECDPTTTCAGGGRCEIETAGGVTFTDCMPPGATPGAAPCVFTTDCPPDDVCRVHGPDQATCEPLCALPGGACPAGAVCTPLADGPTLNGVTYGTCTAPCDLLSPASCGTSDACAVVTDTPGGAPTTDCVTAGAGIGAFGCQDQQLCVPGALCAAFPSASSTLDACETYCRVGQDDCPPQFTCEAFVPAVTIDGTPYGECQDDCNLATPEDICGADAACLPIVDGVNPPHTACAGVPSSCQTVLNPSCQPVQVCTPASAFPLGAACMDATGCPPGSTCATGKCVSWCVMGPSGHCPGGTLCTPGTPPLTIAGVSYGTCQ